MKKRKTTHDMISIIAEYLRPATTRPSPIWPAQSPEKKPWIIAAWVNNRLYAGRSMRPMNLLLAAVICAAVPAVAMVLKKELTRTAITNIKTAHETITMIT